MPGVFEVSRAVPIGTAIEDILLLAECSGRDSPKEERYLYGVAKGSMYEVISLLVMIGKRGGLAPEVYREHYGKADELAAMISGAIKSTYHRQ